MNENPDDLYREVILDHYRSPRGKKKLDHADVVNEGFNPACGDDVEIQVEVDGDKVKELSVSCVGCAISVASGSMLYEVIKGKSIAEVKKIAEVVKALLKGEEYDASGIDLGDLDVLEGVRQFPVRIKCALLSWVTLIEALESVEQKREAKKITTE